MPRYRVTLGEVASYELEVEADNEEEAGEIAEETFAAAENFDGITCEVHERDVDNVELIEE